MILYPGETVLLRGGAQLHAGVRITQGTLTVSSHRLVFEAGGVAPFTVIDVAIERVWNVHVGQQSQGKRQAPREFLTVETHYGRSLFETVQASRWAEVIVSARGRSPPPPPPPPPAAAPAGPMVAAGIPVVINVAAPPAPKVMLTCRYCGNLYDAVGGRCDKCGARP